MKIEIGKYYKTRGGKKILALAVNPLVKKGSDRELVTSSEHGAITVYRLDGSYLGNGELSIHDLVERWIEPEDAPLEFDDIEFGTAFKLVSQEGSNAAVYATSISNFGVKLDGATISFERLKKEFVMQLPGTTEWLPCSKKSVRR